MLPICGFISFFMSEVQLTDTLFMVRPTHFGWNEQTATTNAFQHQQGNAAQNVVQNVVHEFNHFVKKLRNIGLNVITFDSLQHTPDAVFPNNWISFHTNGTLITYPMLAPNRRAELRNDVIDYFQQHYKIKRHLDLAENFVSQNLFLEGTGSLCLDRIHQIAYCCLSPRTNEQLVLHWCEQMEYRPVLFRAIDKNGQAIYHTNVMLYIGEDFAVLAADTIADPHERQTLITFLEETGHEIVYINHDQMTHFGANVLQTQNKDEERVLIISEQAYLALSQQQLLLLNQYNEHILHTPLYNIEKYGGGSARCMMAEVFLPKK